MLLINNLQDQMSSIILEDRAFQIVNAKKTNNNNSHDNEQDNDNDNNTQSLSNKLKEKKIKEMDK